MCASSTIVPIEVFHKRRLFNSNCKYLTIITIAFTENEYFKVRENDEEIERRESISIYYLNFISYY